MRMRATGPVLTITALLLLLTALPDWLQRHGWPPRRTTTLAASLRSTAPYTQDPALRPRALLENGLMQRLRDADRSWIPRAERLPDGGTRYLYKRRPGEPELTIPQIRALIARPPSHANERDAIVTLLTTLERVGAGVGLIEPIKPGAAAEWDPQARTLRLRPDVPDQGSLELARVLNHEAIHVAQSCAAGGVGASPRPLGATSRTLVAATLASGRVAGPRRPIRQLQDPVYADLSPSERRMEQEAYSLQDRLGLGAQLLRIHCLAVRGS